ncbi:MAG TPA: lipopolysaccharide kinase InaA family protein [Planctomycetota bacterium]|jgi:tRNA A-37 threonylcarbamoyl transferase component Bud32|nr:lipopolysaccharide kinase InaA family protein [Planctomycetota bacterium]
MDEPLIDDGVAELASLLDISPTEFLRRTTGRETFAWTWPPGLRVIVKRTRQTRAAWPSRRDVRPGGRREHENLVALAADGLPVPRAVTWCEERGRLLLRPARSVVVMERIEHRENLKERLARCDEAERRSWSRELVRIVARLHARGWRHRDLYLQHFLIPAPEEAGARRLVLIDVGRARRARALSRRWIVKDLAALAHSAPACVGARERLAFLARYLSARGIEDRDERRRFARAILAKAARMRAHVPRDERGV